MLLALKRKPAIESVPCVYVSTCLCADTGQLKEALSQSEASLVGQPVYTEADVHLCLKASGTVLSST